MAKKVNRELKDTVFKIIFGENKKNALALYNAMNNTHYENEENLTVNTIKNAVFTGFANDVSFLFNDSISLYEQQSTFNPNMPLRGLEYFAGLYTAYVTSLRGGWSLVHGQKQIKLPTPKYYVLYNGNKRQPEYMDLHLSDAFEGPGDLEVTAHMININPGFNSELVTNCKPLADYVELIHRIRSHLDDGFQIEDAVSFAIDDCIADGILSDILQGERNRVRNSLITKWDADEYEAFLRESIKEDFLEKVNEELSTMGKELSTADARDIYTAACRVDEREKGIDEGIKEGRKQGKAEGRYEGRAEGQALLISQLSSLLPHLQEADRMDEYIAATQDLTMLKSLLEEFEISIH